MRLRQRLVGRAERDVARLRPAFSAGGNQDRPRAARHAVIRAGNRSAVCRSPAGSGVPSSGRGRGGGARWTSSSNGGKGLVGCGRHRYVIGRRSSLVLAGVALNGWTAQPGNPPGDRRQDRAGAAARPPRLHPVSRGRRLGARSTGGSHSRTIVAWQDQIFGSGEVRTAPAPSGAASGLLLAPSRDGRREAGRLSEINSSPERLWFFSCGLRSGAYGFWRSGSSQERGMLKPKCTAAGVNISPRHDPTAPRADSSDECHRSTSRLGGASEAFGVQWTSGWGTSGSGRRPAPGRGQPTARASSRALR